MIKQILQSQQLELRIAAKNHYIERCADIELREDGLIRAIIGPRRAGKSCLAVNLVGQKCACGYINFDDERLIEIDNYDDLIAASDQVYGATDWLLLDEVQNLPRWELFVNRLQRAGRHLIVTGSNSHLLSSELATHLTGRHLSCIVFPFNFKEYLSTKKDLNDSQRAEALFQYAIEGGFPEPLIKGVDRSAYLRTLVDSILYKDIIRRFRIRAHQGIADLTRYLLSNTACECSYRSLSEVTRCKSNVTIGKYLRYLEQAFLFFMVSRFSFKVREQAAANKKCYCIDPGMAVAAGFNFSANTGRLLENIVAIVLHKKELEGKIELYFWKNAAQEEVDFVVKEGTIITQLIQVCKNPEGPRTHEREVRALLKASRELACVNMIVLTGGIQRIEPAEWFGIQGTIAFIPLWKWLLEN